MHTMRHIQVWDIYPISHNDFLNPSLFYFISSHITDEKIRVQRDKVSLHQVYTAAEPASENKCPCFKPYAFD